MDSKQGPDRATRRPEHFWVRSFWEALEIMLGHFSQFFRILGAFWTHFTPSWCSGTWDACFGFLSIFGRFWMDFGKILGWFFDGFSYFCPKSRFCKNRCFSIGKLLFSRIRACKNQAKIHQKSMQISYGKIRSKKMLKKWIWDGLGLHLGRGWGALGRLLVALGRFLAISGAFKIELL